VSDDAILRAAYVLITPAWLGLMLAPRWRPTVWISRTAAVSLLLSAVYLVLVLLNHGMNDPEAGVWTMRGLTTLFSSPRVVLIGWVHYLAFDLFVGTWVATDAARERLPRLAVLPCLFFVLLMGPIGLLMYFALRLVLRRSWAVFPKATLSNA
jgi:hypothetical protein